MGLIGSISNGNWSHRSPIWSVIIWVSINQIQCNYAVGVQFDHKYHYRMNWTIQKSNQWIIKNSNFQEMKKWKFLLKDWQRRHKLFNVVLKLRLVDLNYMYNFKCHCLLNCPITTCPITTWQINKWKITITIEKILIFLIMQILNKLSFLLSIYINNSWPPKNVLNNPRDLHNISQTYDMIDCSLISKMFFNSWSLTKVHM